MTDLTEEWVLGPPAEGRRVGRHEARFPGRSDLDDLPEYLRLESTDSKKSAYFRSSTRRGATGDVIWVSDAVLKRFQGRLRVRPYQGAKGRRYRFWRLLHDPGQSLALIGLVLALVGLVVDALLAINLVSQIPVVMQLGPVNIMIASFGLKATGLILLFSKGVLQGDI